MLRALQGKVSAATITYAADEGRRGVKFDVVTRVSGAAGQWKGYKAFQTGVGLFGCGKSVMEVCSFSRFPGENRFCASHCTGGKPIPRCRMETISCIPTRVRERYRNGYIEIRRMTESHLHYAVLSSDEYRKNTAGLHFSHFASNIAAQRWNSGVRSGF